MALLLIAAFGLLVPNGLFLHWLFTTPAPLSAMLADRLALGFILDAFLATGLLAWLFALRPPGRVRWPWFLALSLLGGLGFSIPFYLWLNWRRGSASTGFSDWWRTARAG
jgi:hypothetical protein